MQFNNHPNIYAYQNFISRIFHVVQQDSVYKVIFCYRLGTDSAPHPAVIHALGVLAAGNASGIVPFIKLSMTVLQPMLSTFKEDSLKRAFCYSAYY